MGVRNYPDTPRVYIDMDGPQADYDAMAVQLGVPPSELKFRAGVYANLPVTLGAQQAVRDILRMGYQVFSLTKIPRANPYAATEKLIWTHQHFPEIGENVIIAPDKGCVGTQRDFLVDDHPEWANVPMFRGTVLTFKPYNWAELVAELRLAAGLVECEACAGTSYQILGTGHTECQACVNGYRQELAHA